MKKKIINKIKKEDKNKKINQLNKKLTLKNNKINKSTKQNNNLLKPLKNIEILESTTDKEIEFIVKTNPNLKVYLAGTFNNWSSISHPLIEKKKGLYKTSIRLSKGSYEYKYVINNVWCTDNFKPSIWNDMGSMNNILEVY